jgi:hypothetical protein
LQFGLQNAGLAHFRIFNVKGRKLEPGYANYYARGAAEPPGS